jgi:hypothetical protein
LATLPAPANQRYDGLRAATLDAIGLIGPLPTRPLVHLDAGYDYQPCRQVLASRGMVGQIASEVLYGPSRSRSCSMLTIHPAPPGQVSRSLCRTSHLGCAPHHGQ